jgi:hypothetical protein
MTLSCRTVHGDRRVTIHLNSDSTLEIESPPSPAISGTWTIEKAEIFFHYREPFVLGSVDTGWYVADTAQGRFTIIEAVEPEICFWLVETK